MGAFRFQLRSVVLTSALIILAVCASPENNSQAAAQSANTTATSTVPPHNQLTLQSVIHHVVVDVVAKDKNGRPVRDLTEKDFQVFEKVGWIGRVPERIAAFRPVDKTGARQDQALPGTLVKIPAGTYSNLAAVREPDQTLTVILLDELNTNLYAPDVRKQVREMFDWLAQGSYGAPVALLLLSTNLHMLQDFTTDMQQVHSTAEQFLSAGPFHEVQLRVLQTPSPLMQQQFGVAASSSSLPLVRDWSRLSDVSNRDIRVQMTLDAIRAIARHLGGYPGRKKLVWLSGSFPFTTFPDPSQAVDDSQSYARQVSEVTNALSNAQVAIYPIRPGGLWASDVFSAERAKRPGNKVNSVAEALSRESVEFYAAAAGMDELAMQTGGAACTQSNDLAYCLKNVFDDGNIYYEIGYYPLSGTWKPGLHRIQVKTSRPGVRLAYRRAYYALQDSPLQGLNDHERGIADPQLKQAACDDLMAATGIPLSVKPEAQGGSDAAKYSVKVEGSAIAGLQPPDPAEAVHLQLDFAACTFDASGKPLQYMQYPAPKDVDAVQFERLKRTGLEQAFRFQPHPGVSQLRWVVRNSNDGSLGSVDIPFSAVSATEQRTEILATDRDAQVSDALLSLPVQSSDHVGDTPAAAAQNVSAPERENYADMTGYCEGLGRPGPHAEALAKVCEYALSLYATLPNLICDRMTKRYWRSLDQRSPDDEVITRVVFQDGKEYDSDAVAKGHPPSPMLHVAGSGSSGGEFSGDLRGIFSPASDAEFTFKGEKRLGNRTAYLFEYTVQRENNHIYYVRATFADGKGASFYPGYRGKLWVEKSTLQLLRLELETSEIAREFPITHASTAINYANVALGDGTRFVLPVDADLVMCSIAATRGEPDDCTHNLVRFVNVRKFRATTRIVSGAEETR